MTANRFELDAAFIETHDRGTGITRVPMRGRTVYLDLNGTPLTQSILDIICSNASVSSEPLNIVVCRIGMARGIPRLIADTGFIYDCLVKMIDKAEAEAVG